MVKTYSIAWKWSKHCRNAKDSIHCEFSGLKPNPKPNAYIMSMNSYYVIMKISTIRNFPGTIQGYSCEWKNNLKCFWILHYINHSKNYEMNNWNWKSIQNTVFDSWNNKKLHSLRSHWSYMLHFFCISPRSTWFHYLINKFHLPNIR